MIPALATDPVGDFSSPVFLAQAPGSSDTLWVVERGGRIRLVRDGAILPEPFLDVSGDITAGGEQGLLGLAFHPGYATNGRFFVYYTADSPGAGNNTVAEYHCDVDTSPDVAEPGVVARLIDEPDSESNHNGGMIAFGPDGFLYVGMGDEGGGCDGHPGGGNAQNLDSMFGKMHRLDVDNAPSFAAAGNPFMGATGLPQIWHYGLRNPWRFSFDRLTGELYIGDVGQNMKEEISYQAAGGAGGLNYGWRVYEADLMGTCGDDTLDGPSPHTPPIYSFFQGSAPLRGSCAVAGGYVYRGSAIPGLQGVYLFGDNCSDDIAAFRYCGGEVRGVQMVPDLEHGGGLASFGEDNEGELYLIYVGSGEVLKIVPG